MAGFELNSINLKSPAPTLFDRDAEAIAGVLRPDSRHKSNKSSQIRRFYDELLRYESMLRGADSAVFTQKLPLIRMINARAAYAAGRKSEGGTLVDGNFTEFLRAMLDKVEDYPTLKNACTLFEAVIGFSPRD